MGAPRRPLVVCSLELDALGPMLAALEADFDVHTFPLRRDELRGSGRVPPAFEGGAVLVVHVVDGRALLLDDDGFYNGFLVACAHRALGDVFLALAGCETDAGDLSDGAVVRELSGPQPSVGALAAQRRFLTLGATLGDEVVVRDGLSANERVVVRGNEGLREGQSVEVVDDAD